jgi:hypothetical protein
MKRYRQYGPLDDVPEVFGDMQFARLDMKTDPATLPAGSLQVCENMRFDTNGLSVRGGTARQFPAGTNIGPILGCGIYKPMGENDRLAFVTRTTLVLFDPETREITPYAFPAGETVAVGEALDLIQAGIGAGGTLPELFILRGLDQTVLRFTGSAVVVDNDVPKSRFGLFYQNRLAVASGLQALSTSDFLAWGAGHWALLAQFQIEWGGADYLVGAMAYQSDYVLIGSRKKWFLAYFDPGLATANPYVGPIANTSFLRLQTGEAGPVGKEAMLESAGLVWFVTDNGIYAFQPNLNNQLVVLGQPISADIQPVFKYLSAAYATVANIKRFGYRLYFALPISDPPIAITGISSVVNPTSINPDLPQDLPFNLSAGNMVTVTTAARHNLAIGDRVQLTNIAGGKINGSYDVANIVDDFKFSFSADITGDVLLGTRATCQKLAMRNNTIAVFNLNNRAADHPLGAWESIDSLPDGFYADWLRIADFGTQRRLWVVDANNGPALYEEGDVDEIGDVLGGVQLPFELPVDLSAANFASVPIPGRFVSRAYRWEPDLGSGHGTIAYVRKVRASEVRLRLNPGDTGTVITRLRTPNRPLVEQTEPFDGATQADVAVLKRPGQRALEVELEVIATAGRPTVRALEVQVMRSGQY